MCVFLLFSLTYIQTLVFLFCASCTTHVIGIGIDLRDGNWQTCQSLENLNGFLWASYFVCIFKQKFLPVCSVPVIYADHMLLKIQASIWPREPKPRSKAQPFHLTWKSQRQRRCEAKHPPFLVPVPCWLSPITAVSSHCLCVVWWAKCLLWLK